MKHIAFVYQDIFNVNIGDYIQSLAAIQYLNIGQTVYVNRDELALYNGGKAKVIMNGWYSYKPDTCLPNQNIEALFVAFHLNSEVKDKFLTPQNIQILKEYAPIGCRDIYTMNTLQSAGIEAYYSGCLTLTLGHNLNLPSQQNNDIFVVDPYSYMPNGNGCRELIKTLFQFLCNLRPVLKLIKKYKQDNRFTIKLSKVGLGRVLLITKTYLLLKNLFSEDLIWKARYITQYYEHDEYKTDKERFDRARELLGLYSSARYVITSRIHCAFPCLGLETPVAYIRNTADNEKSACRLQNIEDILHIIKIKDSTVVSNFLKEKFDTTTTFSNKSTYKKYRDSLIKKCMEFTK